MYPNSSSLKDIFNLQNKVIQKHINEYVDLYDFISKCFDLVGNQRVEKDIWLTLSNSQRLVYNLFEGDIFSTLINVTRLCLQGCETDAYALMRVVLEELTVFDYISTTSSFDEACQEIKAKSQKPKKFSDKFRFEKAVDNLPKDAREKVYGIYSNIGIHLSPQRLALSRGKSNERDSLKVGMMVGSVNVPISLIHLSGLFLFTIEVFDEFFIKYLPNSKASPFFEITSTLNLEHQNLLSKYDHLKTNN